MSEAIVAVIGTREAFRNFERDHAWVLEWHRDDRFKCRGSNRVFVHVPTMRHAQGLRCWEARLVGRADSATDEHLEVYDYLRANAGYGPTAHREAEAPAREEKD